MLTIDAHETAEIEILVCLCATSYKRDLLSVSVLNRKAYIER